MIETKCPNCGNVKYFSEDKNGKRFKCPTCEQVVEIEMITFLDDAVNAHQSSSQANFVNQDANLQYVIELRNANNQIKYNKLIRKAKVWHGWGIAFAFIAFISFISVLTNGDNNGYSSGLLFGGLGAWFLSKAENIKKEAEEYKTKNIRDL